MNVLARCLLLLLFFVCSSCLPVSAWGQRDIDAWDVIGVYTCTQSGTYAPQKLFLLPDMSWAFTAPFSRGDSLVFVRGCVWLNYDRHTYTPPRFFKTETDRVRLYNTRLMEIPLSPHTGSMKLEPVRVMKGLERPSALSSPQSDSQGEPMLVRAFQVDSNMEQLVEVLPADDTRLPIRCQREPLFGDDRP